MKNQRKLNLIKRVKLSLCLLIIGGCANQMADTVYKPCFDKANFIDYLDKSLEQCIKKINHNQKCVEYGFKQGSTEFSQCLMKLDNPTQINTTIYQK